MRLSACIVLIRWRASPQESLIESGHITDATPLAGSSAGFIAVTCIASGIPFSVKVNYFKEFMRDLRENGTVSRVQPVRFSSPTRLVYTVGRSRHVPRFPPCGH